MKTGEDASLRAVIPFIAMQEFRTSKCLRCHTVEVGAVLGAASVTVDIRKDLAAAAAFNRWRWLGQALVQALLFFLLSAIVARSMRMRGAEPAEAASLARGAWPRAT